MASVSLANRSGGWEFRTNLPFAARFHGELFRLLGDGSRRLVAALSEESGEAEDEDGPSQNHKISAAARACGVGLSKSSKSPLW